MVLFFKKSKGVHPILKNTIHMLKNSTHTQMMSFIIQEKSGKILVVDGGNNGDAPHLLEKLREISGSDTPHIDAWIFTHSHSDHMNAFLTLMNECPQSFEFDKIYCCFPSVQYLSGEDRDAADTLAGFINISPKFADRIVTVSEDDVYIFNSIRMKILFTADCSIKENISNNSSVVFKLETEQNSALFLGDLGVEGGRRLLESKGAELKSDICQMAHHGQEGVAREFYEAVRPEICLWCAPDWLWNNDRGKGFNTHIYQTVIVRQWMDELGVKSNYVIKDGDQRISF